MSQDTSSAPASIVLVGADATFLNAVAAALGPVRSLSPVMITQNIEQAARRPELDEAAVVVVDLDSKRRESLLALQSVTSRIGLHTPVVVLTDNFDDALARWFMQIRVADFLRKPVEPKEVLRACVRALRQTSEAPGGGGRIISFLAAAGGVGATTLAIEAAMLLLRESKESGHDLPRRPRLPDECLRRLSRHRAPARPRRARRASRTARPAAPRGHAQPPQERPRRDCREGPPVGTHGTRSDFHAAPPRSRFVALRERRDRPAAELERLDRPGPHGIEPGLCRDRHDGSRTALRAAVGGSDRQRACPMCGRA